MAFPLWLLAVPLLLSGKKTAAATPAEVAPKLVATDDRSQTSARLRTSAKGIKDVGGGFSYWDTVSGATQLAREQQANPESVAADETTVVVTTARAAYQTGAGGGLLTEARDALPGKLAL